MRPNGRGGRAAPFGGCDDMAWQLRVSISSRRVHLQSHWRPGGRAECAAATGMSGQLRVTISSRHPTCRTTRAAP